MGNDETSSAGSEFEAAQLEQMRALTPVFLEMLTKIGLGKNIGFGCIVSSHPEKTITGALLPFNFDKTSDQMIYGELLLNWTGATFYRAKPISEIESSVFVMPEISDEDKEFDLFEDFPARGGIVSIYDRSNGMSKDAMIGTLAHELAELRVRTIGIPEDMQALLEKKAQDKEVSPWIEPHNRYKESDYDVIAARMGYKKEVLAMLRYGVANLHRLRPTFPQDTLSMRKVDAIISEISFRIEQVEKFS